MALPAADVRAVLDYLCSVAPFLPDPKDDMVAEVAFAAGARYVVTHDLEDFQPLRAGARPRGRCYDAPMSATAPRRATYADVLAAPEHMTAEVIDGELVLLPRPAKPHAAATTALGEELGPPFKRGRGGPGGWILLFEPQLHLGEDILVPDLAGWRRERMPVITTEEPFFRLAPDWACEVLSPSTERVDRKQKLVIYRRERVPHVWLVNPLARTLEVLELVGEHYAIRAVHAGEEKVRAVPFDAIELDLAILWADVELPPPGP